jgi:hypothetical protein
MTNPQSIRPVPIAGHWSEVRHLLQDLRRAVVELQSSSVPPGSVSNLKATAKAGGVILQFTRSDADSYILYTNTVPEISGAVRIDLGLANEYSDDIGQAAVKKFYWIKAKKGQMESPLVGPVHATSLALGTAITFPVPPPASQQPAKSDETNEVQVGMSTPTGYRKV